MFQLIFYFGFFAILLAIVSYYYFTSSKKTSKKLFWACLLIFGPFLYHQAVIFVAGISANKKKVISIIHEIGSRQNFVINRNVGEILVNRGDFSQGTKVLSELKNDSCESLCQYLIRNNFVNRIYGWRNIKGQIDGSYHYWRRSASNTKVDIAEIKTESDEYYKIFNATSCYEVKDVIKMVFKLKVLYRVCARERQFIYAFAALEDYHPYLPFGSVFTVPTNRTQLSQISWFDFYN